VSLVRTDGIPRRRGGFTLLSVGPSLLLALLWTGRASTPAAHPADTDGGTATPSVGVAFPDEFPLFPTFGNEGASGRALQKQVWSPYGVSVDEDGKVEYELTVTVAGLPEVDGETYRVWLTTPTLEEIVDFGVVSAASEVQGSSDFRQLMVVVSRETEDREVAPGERWEGPIVLRGFSAGARVTPLAQHSLFQPSPM
jgi:hypothetical protein